MKSKRIPTDGSAAFGNNPFAALDLGSLPDAKLDANAAGGIPSSLAASAIFSKPKKRLPIHLRIEKAGRGGKTVTVLHGPGVEALSPVEPDTGKRLKGVYLVEVSLIIFENQGLMKSDQGFDP